ncbi:MAG: helix-turn-helix transcriptional regulator [Burkholderiaceae bacterium]|nr:helix-turn-helix transcriptional regulator [Microbacteriaceae bacterium]
MFPDQGINGTGVDQLCEVAGVSQRTLYQHFAGKDELIAEYLRRFDPDVLPEVFDRADLVPRERLLAVFEIHSALCPFIGAAVEAGAGDPERLGEQLALLLDGASARGRVLDTHVFATAAAIAAILIDAAIPATAA